MEEMVEVEDNACEEEYCFTAYEVDIDYEFDASRFFDFTRAESLPEARRAESWFDSAPSCPPSPFAAGLIPRPQTLMDNINVSPKTKGVEVENMNLSECDSDVEDAPHDRVVPGKNKGTFRGLQAGSSHRIQNASQNLPSGLTFYNHMANNNAKSNNQSKMSTKPSFPRTSTLMKPTASQLAKQNHPFQTGYPRPNTLPHEKLDKSSASNFGVENQAAKRQKLEGGLQRKVIGGVQLQQTNFIHKATKRDGVLDGNVTHAKPRITIPREPDLETAHRAQRTRTKGTKDAENPTSTVRRFRALPLNRKILEAPSLIPKRSIPQIPNFQEFHLKTSERAIQHNAAASTSRVPCSDKATDKHNVTSTSECRNREPARPSIMSISRPDGCETSHNFKALPLNKKILTSKGDIGVFRNFKKETTVPMEFNFQREKKFNPPTDLFNKLSLVPESQQTPNFDSKLPHTVDKSIKGSKENHQLSYFNTGNEIKAPGKLKPQQFDETSSGSGWSRDMR